METQLGVRQEGCTAASWAAGHLTSGANWLDVARQMSPAWRWLEPLPVLISPTPHCPAFSNGDGAPAHLLPPSVLSLPLPTISLSLSLWFPLSVFESPDLCLSGLGSPHPGAGLCKCGISCLISRLPSWFTFNLISGSASAEPLINAGRQLGECQGGPGPKGLPGPGAGAMKGRGQGPGYKLHLPRGMSILRA